MSNMLGNKFVICVVHYEQIHVQAREKTCAHEPYGRTRLYQPEIVRGNLQCTPSSWLLGGIARVSAC